MKKSLGMSLAMWSSKHPSETSREETVYVDHSKQFTKRSKRLLLEDRGPHYPPTGWDEKPPQNVTPGISIHQKQIPHKNPSLQLHTATAAASPLQRLPGTTGHSEDRNATPKPR